MVGVIRTSRRIGPFVSSVLAGPIFGPQLNGGLALLYPENAGLAIDFTDPSGLGSVAVLDQNNPANNLSNVPVDSFLTQSGTSPKWVLGPSGLYTQVAAGKVAIEYSGGFYALIEPQATNLLLRSQEFDNAAWTPSSVTVTANQVAAPDGSLTADKLAPSSADSKILQTFTPGSAANHAWSIWLRTVSGTVNTTLRLQRDSPFSSFASQNIAITTTWQRFQLSAAPLDTSAHSVVLGAGATWATGNDLYAWGAQMEAGAFATSPIPTSAATVARAGDVVSVAVTALPFSTAVGSLVAKGVAPAGLANNRMVAFHDGSVSNRITLGRESVAGDVFGEVISGGVVQASMTLASAVANLAAVRLAMRWQANDFAGSYNGNAVVTDVSGSVPAGIATLAIGLLVTTGQFQGKLNSVVYLPRGLSNAELQARTA